MISGRASKAVWLLPKHEESIFLKCIFMSANNYQEPIEKEDVDIQKKFSQPEADQPLAGADETGKVPEMFNAEKSVEKGEILPETEKPEIPAVEGVPGVEGEIIPETGAEQAAEKIETARKTIQTQKPAAAASVRDDAKAVAAITDYEKKVEKLVELALQKGPEHAIRIAQHMDANDNYTLDELHDRMLEDDLRKQLISKGLLKEL